MNGVLVTIGIFIAVVALFILVYEKPAKSKNKITGRGGDFES
jgi:hypothetical protein